jgi:uncharacterized protein YyaL (SSP411 family)
MERESFENEEIANVLNQYFVPIKVDREERPDVDRVYMLFVQASTGSGGWPMSVFLTPDRKPFFGGTYFPPDNRFGRPGFKTVLERLAQAWREDRARIESSGAQVIEQLRAYAGLGSAAGQAGAETGAAGAEQRAEGGPPAGPSQAALDRAYQGFRRMFDPRLGGFGRAPKFPRPSIHNFLLRYSAAHTSAGAAQAGTDALEMVLHTLREMEKGGMNDQIGGGFHRYSVDDHWFVPHFEKMLYDQAQLAASYLEAFQITRDGQYASAARAILDYVLRDMTSPEGGFYSAEDADSIIDSAHPREKGEGAFYIWTAAEIRSLLGDAAGIFNYRYGVRENGNVDPSEDPHGEFRGRNILYQAHTIEETAAHFGRAPEEIRETLRQASQKLLAARSQRPRPLRDDKILAGWNGLMISAFSKGAQILDEPRYTAAARRAAGFLRKHLWDSSREILLRRHRDGESAIDGFLDDYAFCGLALLDLYETIFERGDLDWAIRLAERAIALFEDREHGAFFSTSADDDAVLRLKDDYDGAEPSGNSAIAMLLLRLARMTDREDFRSAAERTLKAFASRLSEAGTALPQMLAALSFALAKPCEIVLAGPAEAPEMREMLAAVRRRFLPSAIVMRGEHCARPMPAIGGRPTAYVCENFACKLPVSTAAALEEIFDPQPAGRA